MEKTGFDQRTSMERIRPELRVGSGWNSSQMTRFNWQRPAEDEPPILAVPEARGYVDRLKGAGRNTSLASIHSDGGWWWGFEALSDGGRRMMVDVDNEASGIEKKNHF